MIILHTTPTANGYKASIMLEETGLPYRVIEYNLVKGENFSPEYLAINPVGRVPTIVDHSTNLTAPLSVYGSAAILLYLAEKTGRFMPTNIYKRAKVYEWLGIIASDVSPAFSGQFVFGVVAPEKLPWAIEFYEKLCIRMLHTMDLQLSKTPYLTGEEYSIADIIGYPVALISMKRYPGNLESHPNIARWAALLSERPAIQRGMKVPI